MSAKSLAGRAGKSRPETDYADTYDGRYFGVRGRLWRKSNPASPTLIRDELLKDLMSARLDVRKFLGDRKAYPRRVSGSMRLRLRTANVAQSVELTAPDFNRHLAPSGP